MKSATSEKSNIASHLAINHRTQYYHSTQIATQMRHRDQQAWRESTQNTDCMQETNMNNKYDYVNHIIDVHADDVSETRDIHKHTPTGY